MNEVPECSSALDVQERYRAVEMLGLNINRGRREFDGASGQDFPGLLDDHASVDCRHDAH